MGAGDDSPPAGAAPLPLTVGEFRALLQDLADCWQRRDYVAACRHFAADVRYSDPLRYALRSRSELLAFFTNDEGLPQCTEWHTVVFDPERQLGAAEYTYDGSRRYHGVALVRLAGGVISHWREYQHVDGRSPTDFQAGTAGLA